MELRPTIRGSLSDLIQCSTPLRPLRRSRLPLFLTAIPVTWFASFSCQQLQANVEPVYGADLFWEQRYLFLNTPPELSHQRFGLPAHETLEVDRQGSRSVVRVPNRPHLARGFGGYRHRGPLPFRYVEPNIVARRTSDDPRALYTGYKDEIVVERILRFLERRYPRHARVHEIGRSVQGRPILALKISDGVDADEDEPAVLFNAAHHGNEPLTPDFAIDLAAVLLSALDPPGDSLLETTRRGFDRSHFKNESGRLKAEYATERLRAYVNDFEIWIVPVVNPDGLSAFWNRDANMGRKNGRETAPPAGFDALDGVDLNRNYPFYWKSSNPAASSPLPDHKYYRGQAAGSEPETKAMMDLARRERFTLALSFHSWATRVLVPYTIDEVMSPFPHVARQIGAQIAAAGQSFLPDRKYEAQRNLYPVDGTDEDWMFFNFGTMAFIVESSFHTPVWETHGQMTIDGLRSLSLRALELCRAGPILTVRVRDTEGRPVPETRLRLKEFAYFEGEQFFSNQHGRYDFFLPAPGEYTVVAGPDRGPHFTQKIRCDRGICPAQITLTGP